MLQIEPVSFAEACAPLIVEAPPLTGCRVAVVVPVKDEASRIERTLAALAAQVDLAGRPLASHSYEVIVLANNCRDDSALLARRFGRARPSLRLHVIERTLPPPEAHVGRARQLLMDVACHRLATAQRGIIASTDGDSCVASDWLAQIMREIDAGADAVGGRIVTDPGERAALDPGARHFHLRDVGYQYLCAQLEDLIDPDPCDRWPRHFQHYGASLAVTAAAYTRAGGLPPVRTPEDVALVRSLRRIDARIRHSPRVRVLTSARAVGRATHGLAAQLATWGQTGEHLVESAAAIEARLLLRRRLRALWRQSHRGVLSAARLVRLAEALALGSRDLAAALHRHTSFGALWEALDGDRYPLMPLVPVAEALQRLRERIVYWRSRC